MERAGAEVAGYIWGMGPHAFPLLLQQPGKEAMRARLRLSCFRTRQIWEFIYLWVPSAIARGVENGLNRSRGDVVVDADPEHLATITSSAFKIGDRLRVCAAFQGMFVIVEDVQRNATTCLLYTSPSPRD